MNTRKAVINGAVIAGLIAVIGVMWFVKNGKSIENLGTVAQFSAPATGESPLVKAPEPETITKPKSAASVGSPKAEKKLPEKIAETPAVPAKTALVDGPLNLSEPFDLAEYRAAGVPVIIDFGADSCIPCKEMAPVLVALHDELRGKAIIRFVDVWKYRDLANGIPLQVIPTQVFFDSTGKPFTPSEKLQIPMTQYSTRDTDEHVFTTHEGGITKDQLLSVLYEMGMQK